MKIAISTDGNFVSQHFGRCPNFTLVDIENGKIVNKTIIDNPGHQPGYIPQYLNDKGVKCIVCGGMGMNATGFFNQLGIETVTGVTGSIEDTIENLKNGTLKGGKSLCNPGDGKGYGVEKTECDHEDEE